MEFRCDTAGSRRALLLLSLAIAASLTYQAIILWIAGRRIDSQQAETIERGATLLPGDGEGWDRLGRLRQWDFVDPSPSAALTYYQHAVQDDPRSAHYWMDLAGAYEDVGDNADAEKAFERARAVYPLSAEVTWNYGNFLLREQNYSRAYVQIRKAVESDSSLLPLAVSRTWRATGDIGELLNEALPTNSQAYLQALDFFVSIRRADLWMIVWRRLVALGNPLELARSFPLIDELIGEDRSEDARRVWRDALAASGTPLPGANGPSVIWDGDFSTDFTNGGLGWRWGMPFATAINFDAPPSGTSGRSIRIDFGGASNLALDTPGEFIPVEPNRSYHFRGMIRTADITTESGIRFSLSDPNRPEILTVFTDEFIGTHPWTTMDADLTTSAQTHFVVVRLVRSPSRLFDNKLGGSVWVANLSLTAVAPSAGGDGHASSSPSGTRTQ